MGTNCLVHYQNSQRQKKDVNMASKGISFIFFCLFLIYIDAACDFYTVSECYNDVTWNEDPDECVNLRKLLFECFENCSADELKHGNWVKAKEDATNAYEANKCKEKELL